MNPSPPLFLLGKMKWSMPTTILAWSFESRLQLYEMVRRLGDGWVEGDSERKSYIGGTLMDGVVAKIYDDDGLYVANLKIQPREGVDLEERIDKAKRKLLDGALPLVEAKDVKTCPPYE